jgi:uncharacterized protein YktA (UPF0223 family)
MKKTQKFVNQYLKFLNISNEQMVPKDDSVILKINVEIELKLSDERGAIYFDFRNAGKVRGNEWYDLDIIRSFIQNPSLYELGNIYLEDANPYDLKLQDERALREVTFLKNNIKKIIEMFSSSRNTETFKAMKKLRNQRAKKLYVK